MFTIHRKFALLILVSALLLATFFLFACEDIEVADYNPEFRAVPTVQSAPTIESAPTAQAAPTVAKFEGFKQAPTAERAGEFKQAPTVEKAGGFNQAPTATKFEGFNEGNPCETYLENPTPKNGEQAAQWAADILEAAGNQINPNDPTQVTTACQAALNRYP